jgi:hypothetical protein
MLLKKLLINALSQYFPHKVNKMQLIIYLIFCLQFIR